MLNHCVTLALPKYTVSIDSCTSINIFYIFISFTLLINAVILLLNCLIVSPKSDHRQHLYMLPRLQKFLAFNLQATFLLGFLLNFASGLLWQRSGHPLVMVAQKLKLCSGESKM